MHAGTIGLLAAAACAVTSAAAANPTSRLPRPRPAVAPPAETRSWANDAAARFEAAMSDATFQVARLPRPRPVTPVSLPPEADEQPEADAHEPAKPPIAVAPESDADYAACLAKLDVLGVTYKEMPPLDPGGTCHVAHPLKVTSLGSGVAIGPETVLDCAMTRALAEWLKEVVVPEAERDLDAPPVAIEQDSAYVCRNRYGNPDAKLSEHAIANALDVATFAFKDHETVGIGHNPPGSAEARFEAAIRAGSCRYFTTVLGPGSNAAHATHFHLDLAYRKSGYRICELGPPEPATARASANTSRE
jgi:hypothetical protein